MTEPQRKRLLELVGHQGKTGKEAEDYLCQELGVKQLSEASLTAASALIKRLIAETAKKATAAKAERSAVS